MPSTIQSEPKFHVGESVSFEFGLRQVRGKIVEDRGPLGVKGRRIYGVQLDMDPLESMFFELPEDELQSTTEADAPLKTGEIRDYLRNGGLLWMLGAGSDGSSPPVWLRRNTLGNVTHTFVEERGMVGGGPIPPRAESGDKIFTPLRQKVIRFVRSFGLSEKDAISVVDAIGTHP